MKRFFVVFIIAFVILIGFFQYSRNSSNEINYDRFNLVAPGILRTPDERFNDIKDYPFSANYLTIGDTRIHYLDEGPIDGKILFIFFMVNLHGVTYLEK